MRKRRGVLGTLLAAAVLGATGCLQIETNIHLNEDGSATVTERLNFSRKLLDMASGQEAGLQLEPMLAREAALERMKDMGKGVSLVNHKVQDGAKGSRESIAVYQAQDLAQFLGVLGVSQFAAAELVLRQDFVQIIAGDQREMRRLLEVGDQHLGDGIAKVVQRVIAAGVDEGDYRDGFAGKIGSHRHGCKCHQY